MGQSRQVMNECKDDGCGVGSQPSQKTSLADTISPSDLTKLYHFTLYFANADATNATISFPFPDLNPKPSRSDAFDVVVTTYEMAKSPNMKSVLTSRTHWRYMVLDEGHVIKVKPKLTPTTLNNVAQQPRHLHPATSPNKLANRPQFPR